MLELKDNKYMWRNKQIDVTDTSDETSVVVVGVEITGRGQ